MADETGRENIEGISIDEFMSVADDGLSVDTGADELIDTSIDGSIDDIFNIEDIDLDDISLSDLMMDDLDDDSSGSAAELIDDYELSDGDFDGELSLDDELSEEQDVLGEDSFSMESVSQSEEPSNDEITADGMLSDGEDISQEMDLTNDISSDESINETADSDGFSVSDDIDIDSDDTDFSLDDDVPDLNIDDEDIDLMQLLTGDDDEDDFELLEDDHPSEPEGGENHKEEDADSDDAAKIEKAPQKGNVFADPLSVLSDDVDDSDVAVGDVDEILDSVKKKSKKSKKSEKSEKKKKKSGKGIGRFFSNIVDEKELEKVEQEKRDAEQAEKKKAADAEKKQKLAEEKAGKKEEKKLAKEKLKESKKQEKEAKKLAKKEEKERRKLEEETEVEGRINKVGATIVFVLFGCAAAFIFFGTKMFSYNSSISNAMSYFENGRYEESYNELVGEDLKEEDKALYNKVVTIMYVYKQLDAYDAYYKAAKYPQALDSLLKGVREYDKYMPDAIEFDITDNFDSIKNQIIGELSAEYGITEDMAREINNISDSAEYSKRVYSLAQNLSSSYY